MRSWFLKNPRIALYRAKIIEWPRKTVSPQFIRFKNMSNGGLMAYSIDVADVFRRLAYLCRYQRCEPGRFSVLPTHQIRAEHQSQNCENTRARQCAAMLLGRADEVIEESGATSVVGTRKSRDVRFRAAISGR